MKEIDLFFHDSNHSEEHKRFEYDLAVQYLNIGRILSSHDVGHGSDGSPATYAFTNTAKELGAEIYASRKFTPGDDDDRVFAYFQIL